MVDRFGRAEQSLNNTLSLLQTAERSDQLRSVVSDIAHFVQTSDLIEFTPYDETLDPTHPTSHGYSVRSVSGLLPPSAFVFQAMPEDIKHFPSELHDERPGYYAVIHKYSVAGIDANAVKTPSTLS